MSQQQTLSFPKKERLTLESLCDGAVLNEINAELAKLQEDITNKKKVPKCARELTIKIKIMTDDKRNVESIQPQVTTKLAPFEVDEGQRFFNYETMGDLPK